MVTRKWTTLIAVLFVAVSLAAARLYASDYDSEEYGKLLKALPTSKHTLADGIRYVAAKGSEVALAAKYKLDKEGKLTMYVCTATEGLSVAPDKNVYKKYYGSPVADKWVPEEKTISESAYIARDSSYLTLLATSSYSLLDIYTKAGKDYPGTVLAIWPAVTDRKAVFHVLVGSLDRVIELRYDLETAERITSWGESSD